MREIQTLLKLGRIHSLYKIQVEGEWILLRDQLAELEQKARNSAKARTTSPGLDSRQHGLSTVPVPKVIPDEPFLDSTDAATTGHSGAEGDAEEDHKSEGIGITSFVLSLFFFVPFLNGITWLLSLIFGHLALSQVDDERRSKSASLAWVGLWISYVELSFFLLGFAWFAIMGFSRTPMMLAYLFLHTQMLYTVVAALIGAGVLMLAVKISSGSLISYRISFVGALAPSALGNFGTLLIQTAVTSLELQSVTGILLIATQYLILFVAQMFFWARFIRLPDDSELGIGRAALSSLFYTVIFVVIGIAYLILFATLSRDFFKF